MTHHRLPCSTLHRPSVATLGLGFLAGLIALDVPAAPPAPVAPIITSAATRFTDNGNGTVTDNVTGLIWLTNANCFGTQSWYAAISSADTTRQGSCGLSDGSGAGQWRLPNRNELQSLIDYTRSSPPALPVDHPFTNVPSAPSYYYWSSTTFAPDPSGSGAWRVSLSDGGVAADYKGNFSSYVWPVRGGQ